MDTIEIARRLAELGQTAEAQAAYRVVLQEVSEQNPELELEAASYLFFSKGDYQIAYTSFVSLYNRGKFQNELMELMTQAFYLPHVKEQRRRYRDNCERLNRYPYLFRKDFPDFDALPIRFFPFSDEGYIPFYQNENRFGAYVNFREPIIDRYFFADLEQPVLAKDVFSQYQLEYLHDNVRKSEWVGRENHIYLHYTDWEIFCAHLQCLELQPLLSEKKLVFLIGEEIKQYPIDFKERFRIDYSKYPLRPLSYREVTRLIWHTQLAAHNGGDFFNEIFHAHPNLLTLESVMFHDLQKKFQETRADLKRQYGKQMPHLTDKDLLVSMLMGNEVSCQGLDRASRICPAVFFQPHFSNMLFTIQISGEKGLSTLYSEEYESIRTSPIFQGFKYIKTFTPMRRITTSYAATVRFMLKQAEQVREVDGKKTYALVSDVLLQRLQNRSFLVDWQDRLYHDSVLVRFEDGKLNPTATFTALAEFLDIPYTESMTYCSGEEGLNPESLEGNARGFDPATVYSTYDDYGNDEERAFLEYFLRDAYEYYGYSFHYYKGQPVDEAWIQEKLGQFSCMDGFMVSSRKRLLENVREKETGRPLTEDEVLKDCAVAMAATRMKRANIALHLLHGLRFVNKQGQPLKMMKPLKLDPALLEQPLYH